MKCMNNCLVFKLDDPQLSTLVKASCNRLTHLVQMVNDDEVISKAEKDDEMRAYLCTCWDEIKVINQTLQDIHKEVDIVKKFGGRLMFDTEMSNLILRTDSKTLYQYAKSAAAKRKERANKQ